MQWDGLAMVWRKKHFVTALCVFSQIDWKNNLRSIFLNSFLEIYPSGHKIRIGYAFPLLIWRAQCQINVSEKLSLSHFFTCTLGFTVKEHLLEFGDQRKAQEPATKKVKAFCVETSRENLVKIMLARQCKKIYLKNNRNSHQRCSIKKVFLKKLQNTCVGVFF